MTLTRKVLRPMSFLNTKTVLELHLAIKESLGTRLPDNLTTIIPGSPPLVLFELVAQWSKPWHLKPVPWRGEPGNEAGLSPQ